RPASSEVPLPLLLFHAALGVVVDETTLAFGVPGEQHLANDLGQGGGGGADGAGQRVATQRSEANHFQARFLSGAEGKAVVVDHDQGAFAVDDGALCREVQRNDLDVLEIDVQPDVELGPVGQREGADALTTGEAP